MRVQYLSGSKASTFPAIHAVFFRTVKPEEVRDWASDRFRIFPY
jgi:hypothetical protein